MTDRELLELAAKAGDVGDIVSVSNIGLMIWSEASRSGILWNPLTSDADAFRLMVATGVAVFPPQIPKMDGDFAVASIPDCYEIENNWMQEMVGDGDPLAATRRAITRATAEIQLAKERNGG